MLNNSWLIGNDNNWNFPVDLLVAYPYLLSIPDKITLPLFASDDVFLWNHSHDGNLSFKDAYQFQCHDGQQVPWAKIIWNPFIPPSKSFLLWRSLHGKLPYDDNLAIRGCCCLPSICNLCGNASETTSHLFLNCIFASSIWNWLSSILQVSCSFTSLEDTLK
ncbi:ribonuclease H protein, partial [Trifolium medium]|nr:ribonuclease H protein [Trifolium medium]